MASTWGLDPSHPVTYSQPDTSNLEAAPTACEAARISNMRRRLQTSNITVGEITNVACVRGYGRSFYLYLCSGRTVIVRDVDGYARGLYGNFIRRGDIARGYRRGLGLLEVGLGVAVSSLSPYGWQAAFGA